MSKIKNFFMRKKEEAAFKLKLGGGLGQGHSLNTQNAEASTSSRKPESAYVPPKRKELSNEARTAAAAAVARIEKKSSRDINTSLNAIKAQARKELEIERKVREELPSSETTTSDTSLNANYACHGVFFRCPIVDESVLPKKEWKDKIKTFLYQQPESEKALTSCLIIQNCNSKEKAQECVKTLSKYLENIIKFPEEEKYYKIRIGNRIFSENVRYIEGALDFLHAAGFREIDLDDEKYLIWTEDNVETGYTLSDLLEALNNSEPFQLILDRNLKVLLPSQAKCVELPPEFYRISPEELKREQHLKTEAIESSLILKTKAMREREEQKTLRMYKYALIRVKFPDGLIIQGTFGVYEKLQDVFEFVQSCLYDEDLKFNLVMLSGGKFTEEDMNKTLYDLRLVPNIALLFTVQNDTLLDSKDNNFLKEDLLLLVQTV